MDVWSSGIYPTLLSHAAIRFICHADRPFFPVFATSQNARRLKPATPQCAQTKVCYFEIDNIIVNNL